MMDLCLVCVCVYVCMYKDNAGGGEGEVILVQF